MDIPTPITVGFRARITDNNRRDTTLAPDRSRLSCRGSGHAPFNGGSSDGC